jgi:hypothetical protein
MFKNFKKIQDLDIILSKNNLSLFNVKIFLPFYFDFRGREYYDSSISPSLNKYFRLVFFYGYYKKEELVNNCKKNQTNLIIERYY